MDLNIRDVPEELRQAVKIKATQEGVTLREFVLRVLAHATNGKLPAKEKAGK